MNVVEKAFREYIEKYNQQNEDEKKQKKLQMEIQKNEEDKNAKQRQLEMLKEDFNTNYSKVIKESREKRILDIEGKYNAEIKSVDQELSNFDLQRNSILTSQFGITKKYKSVENLGEYTDKVDNELAIIGSYLPSFLVSKELDSIYVNHVEDLKAIAETTVCGELPMEKNTGFSSILNYFATVGGGALSVAKVVLKLFWPFPIWWLNIIYWLVILYFSTQILDFLGMGLLIVVCILLGVLAVMLLYLFAYKPIMAFKYLRERKSFYNAVRNYKSILDEVYKKELEAERKTRLDKLEQDKQKMSSNREELIKQREQELKKCTAMSDEEFGNEVKTEYEINRKEVENNIAQIESDVQKKKSQLDKLMVSTQKRKAELIDELNNLKSMNMNTSESDGALADDVYIVPFDEDKKYDEVMPVSCIHHCGKPTVFLYDLDTNVANTSDVTSQLKNFIITMLEGFYRVNAHNIMEHNIVDTLSGATDFLAEPYDSLFVVYDKPEKLKMLEDKVENLMQTVSVTGQLIKDINQQRLVAQDPPIKYQIVNFIVPPIDSNANTNILSDNMWRLMQKCETFGYFPIFFIQNQDWKAMRSGTGKGDTSLIELNKRIDSHNVYYIDLKTCICKEESMCENEELQMQNEVATGKEIIEKDENKADCNTELTEQDKLFEQAKDYYYTNDEDAERKAYRIMLELAEQKYTDAYYFVGAMLSEGCGVEEDQEQALEWFKKSSDAGDVEGMYFYAEMIWNNSTQASEENKAFQLAQKAVELGFERAYYVLARIYYEAEFIQTDIKKAIEYAEKVVKNEETLVVEEAMCLLGDIYADENTPFYNQQKSVEWYQKSSERGNMCAKSVLLECYAQDKDCVNALRMVCELVSEYDEREYLWELFHERYCCEFDYEIISDAEWDKLVEKCPSIMAIQMYASWLRDENVAQVMKLFNQVKTVDEEFTYYMLEMTCGDNGEMPYEEFVPIAEADAENGSIYAMTFLGTLVYAEEDYMKWLRKAVAQGSERAKLMLGVMYFQGDIVEEDYEIAYDLLSDVLSLEADREWWLYEPEIDPFHGFNTTMGICFLKGCDAPDYGEKAKEWFEKDEDIWEYANYYLGVMYCEGAGIKRDKLKGLSMLRELADEGFEPAISYLEDME